MVIDWSEHYIKKGDPAAPTYYIIRRADPAAGLFSNYGIFAAHIRHALTKKYIPVIDMKNYPSAYLSPDLIGRENAWEYYFEQPFRVSLEYAYTGENVLLNHATDIEPWPKSSDMSLYKMTSENLIEWRMLVKLGLLKIQPQLQKEIDAIYSGLFSSDDRVLAVHLRGTDYVAKKPYSHPIPPPIEYTLPKVILWLREWNCNKVFLATEDINIAQAFRNILGETCVMLPKEYLKYDGKTWISSYHTARENDHFLRGKEYLTEMVIASKCSSFVTDRTSGAVGVMMMADNFEHVHAFNFGIYGVIALGDFIGND